MWFFARTILSCAVMVIGCSSKEPPPPSYYGDPYTWVPERIEEMKSTDPTIRAGAAYEIMNAPREARAAAEPLRPLLRDPVAEVRKFAVIALGRVAHLNPDLIPTVTAEIFALVEDEDPGVRRSAIGATIAIEAKGEKYVSAILRALKDSNSEVRLTAAWALVQVEPTDPAGMNALKSIAAGSDSIPPDSRSERVMTAAREALGRIETRTQTP